MDAPLYHFSQNLAGVTLIVLMFGVILAVMIGIVAGINAVIQAIWKGHVERKAVRARIDRPPGQQVDIFGHPDPHNLYRR